MDLDIEFLYNFILYDRKHLEDLYEPLYFALHQIGHRLRNKVPSLIIVYDSENSPMYELIELLDGNNFEINYGKTIDSRCAVEAIPIYPETITVTYIPENEIYTSTTETYTQYTTEYVSDIPEVRNPPRRGLRAKVLLMDDISFNEKLFDEFLKPPQRRKE